MAVVAVVAVVVVSIYVVDFYMIALARWNQRRGGRLYDYQNPAK
jgi:hypothetical protein